MTDKVIGCRSVTEPKQLSFVHVPLQMFRQMLLHLSNTRGRARYAVWRLRATTDSPAELGDARGGRCCCCYDAIVTAPRGGAGAGVELSEFPPGQTSRREPAGQRQASSATVYGRKRPGVRASPGASRVMTAGHSSNICSPLQREAPTPCSPRRRQRRGAVCILLSAGADIGDTHRGAAEEERDGGEKLQRAAHRHVGAHGGCRADAAGGGPGEAGGAGAGAV